MFFARGLLTSLRSDVQLRIGRAELAACPAHPNNNSAKDDCAHTCEVPCHAPKKDYDGLGL